MTRIEFARPLRPGLFGEPVPLMVAAPVMLAVLLTDCALGVVSKIVPQLNVFAVGFPTKVAVALLIVGASLPFVSNWISGQLSTSVGAALGALHVA